MKFGWNMRPGAPKQVDGRDMKERRRKEDEEGGYVGSGWVMWVQ